MSTLTQDVPVPSAKELAPVPRERRRRWTYYVLPIYSSGFFLYLLIPMSALLVLAILGVFGWALHGGQFDNLEKEGERILAPLDDGQGG